jgi:hypothetical protein
MFDESTQQSRMVFGEAKIEARLRSRVVEMAAQCFRAPAGTVTSVFTDSAGREAAYRFLANPRVTGSHLMGAQAGATAKLARAFEFVFVPVDGSSLSVTDRKEKRAVGAVGAHKFAARGLIVASALAVSPDGTPLGLCGQRWWARNKRRKTKKRKSKDNELNHAVAVVDDVLQAMAAKAPATTVWFQLDRGYDAQIMLEHLVSQQALFTVRASHNRRLATPGKAKRAYLEPTLVRCRILGRHWVEIPARDGLPSRVAELDVRVLSTTISAERHNKSRCEIPLTYVDVRERGRPQGLRWTLITNAQVDSLKEAITVVDGYTTRWRIEEFHRAWKRGVCHVEDTQLRGREAIIKWATMLGAVAVRATRLAYLAREKPDLPATEEFSPAEMLAAEILSERPVDTKHYTLAQMVDLVAKLGGYTGKSSGGPPGPTTLARGLRRVIDAAKVTARLMGAAGSASKK